jgi:competence protein ComEC
MRASWSREAGAPSLPLAGALAAGILAAAVFPVPPRRALGAALATASAIGIAFAPRKSRVRAFAGLVLAAAAGFWNARERYLLPAHRSASEAREALARALAADPTADGALLEVTGRLDAPWTTSGSLFRTRLAVEAASSDGRKLRLESGLPLTVAGQQDPSGVAELGDRVRVRGTLRLPEAGGPVRSPFDLPAEPRLALKSTAQVERLGPPAGLLSPVARAHAAVKRRLRANLADASPEARGALALLLALVMGETQDLPGATVSAFRDGGVAHIVAISGLQVGLVAALLGWLARRLGASLAARDGFVLVATALFAVFAGGRPPVVRAALMIGLYLLARLLGRPTSATHVLGFAAAVLLAADPSNLFDVGFLLTFAAVFGLAAFGVPAAKALRRVRVPGLVADAIGATAGAELAVLPIQLFVFNVVPVVALLSNPFVVPLSSVFLFAGFLLLPLLLLSPASAAFAIVPLRFLSDVLLALLSALDRLHAVRIVPTPAFGLVAATAALLVVAGLTRRPAFQRASFAGAAIVALALVLARPIAAERGSVVLQALDVGQGDAWLLVTQEGRVLVDGGGSPDRAYDFGRLRLMPRLADLGAVAFDAVVLTHPHPDHARGLLAVLTSLPVARVVLPRAAPRNLFLDEFEDAAARRHLSLERFGAGQRFMAAGLSFDVLHPGDGPYPRARENNGSLVLRVALAGRIAILSGDIEALAESDLVASDRNLAADVLKIPHHGSRTSTSAAFLARVSPRLGLIGVGRRNRFGHPAADVVERLTSAGVRTFRTDRDGDIALLFGGGRIRPVFAESVARGVP